MIKIDEKELEKKIRALVFKDIEKLNTKVDIFFQKLYALEEKINCLEDKNMTEKMFPISDEFDLADMENDEKKLNEMNGYDLNCKMCNRSFPQEELKALTSSDMICEECNKEYRDLLEANRELEVEEERSNEVIDNDELY